MDGAGLGRAPETWKKRGRRQQQEQTYVANEGGVDEGGDWVSHERERAGHRDLHDLLPELVPSEGEPEDGRSARGDEKQVEIKQQAIAGAPAWPWIMDGRLTSRPGGIR